MATKRICDRCGAEINPPYSVTYVRIGTRKYDIADNEYELCCSCAFNMRKWMGIQVSNVGNGSPDNG